MAKRKITHLNIWMNGVLVGDWRKKAGVEELIYAQSWVDSKQGRPLSLSLPFTPGNQKHRGDNVKFYFDNLLPDSEGIRNRLAVKFGTNSASPFDLLVELGRDCVGAIQLLRPDEEPIGIHKISAKPVSDAEIAERLRNAVLSDGLFNKDNDDFRISLAGAQEKTAFLWHNEQWCVPLGATPTTHIFKLPLGLAGNISADINSVENEWLCSKILDGFGIPVAYCDIGQFEDQKVLIVERFDRVHSENDSWIIRLPQEDFCQANAISPLQKYQKDGGLGITECMKILDGSSESIKNKYTFFAVQVIYWLLFAIDGHAKNYSIKHTSRDSYEMTPVYDVLSIFPILGPKQDQIARRKAKLAMAVRGSSNYYVLDRIMKRHFISHAVSVGISKEEAIRIIDDIIEATPAVIEYVYGLLPEGFNQPLADSILQGMHEQKEKLAGMPTEML
ncbi:MAG: serine/threonine-protein kinase HipA [Alteromonadaceae bacterium]|jgi:serine/threonine-protein kinase HipA